MKLTQTQKQKIKEIAGKYQLKLVLLFGSQSSGYIHKESDVDVAYLPEKSLDFEKEYRLNYEFTKIFQTDKVDTVDLRKASPLLLYAVFQNPIILFQENDLVFPLYRAYVFKRYIEAKSFYKEKFQQLSKK